MQIDLNAPSHHRPDQSIRAFIMNQLAIAKISTAEWKHFENEITFISRVYGINYHIEKVLESNCDLDDIRICIECLQEDMHQIARRLSHVQRSTVTATPKNIFLNRLHNSHALILLELSNIVSRTMKELSISHINSDRMNRLVNEPYERDETIAEAKPVPSTPPSTPSGWCCYKSSNKTMPENLKR